MPTEIHFQGGSIEVVQSFDTVRKNFDAATKAKIAFDTGVYDGSTKGTAENGFNDQRVNLLQRCVFNQIAADGAKGGKVAIHPDKVIALVDLATSEE